MKNICIFASGSGSNFEALVKAQEAGIFKAKIALLICDQPDALVLKRAERLGIKAAVVKREDFSSKADFESQVIRKNFPAIFFHNATASRSIIVLWILSFTPT